ncbi:uncharacterized protein LOC124363674 [Homalodisca vitripennis]|uniref:uncharacterized protein LOC124363674 n=1 Tax=Homalodisca vitripennis TaxID=197043 RepID=UPI001EEA6B25|nr:uncharacterized protein LOC124363674 [Homalodisca vitripennis]
MHQFKGKWALLQFCQSKKKESWKTGFWLKPNLVFQFMLTKSWTLCRKIVKDEGRETPFSDGRPGKKWLELFLKRHPNIAKDNTEIISKARASVTEPQIREWFSELKNYLKDVNAEDILNDPTRIFNLDETGMCTCPKSGKVLGPKSYKNFYEISPGPEKECITVLCTFSAAGKVVQPMIVYPFKRMPRDIVDSVPPTFSIGRSDSGWMVSGTFYEYMANSLYPWLVDSKVQLPVLVFFGWP